MNDLKRMFHGDLSGCVYVTLTYRPAVTPKNVLRAKRLAERYVERIDAAREKQGLPPSKAAIFTQSTTDADGARIHHHILMLPGLSRHQTKKQWKLGMVRVDGDKTPWTI